MRIFIRYDDLADKSMFHDKESVAASMHLKASVNGMAVHDVCFKKSGTVELVDAKLKTSKPNKLRFRVVAEDESEQIKHAAITNVLRGILFVIMAIFLPFAVMRFKSVKTPFVVQKFAYSPEHDLILLVDPRGYSLKYEKASIPLEENDPYSLHEHAPSVEA